MRMFRLVPRLLLFVPALMFTDPDTPWIFFVLVTMLMMPPVPSASYFAPGLVITSTRSITSAGIIFTASAMLDDMIVEGLPFIRTLMLLEPCMDTFPSRSTVSRGVRRKTSAAVPPRDVTSLEAL